MKKYIRYLLVSMFAIAVLFSVSPATYGAFWDRHYQRQWTLTMSVQPVGSGSTSPSGTLNVDVGRSARVTATAKTGYHFVNWKFDNNVLTSNPVTISSQTSGSTHQLIAVFELDSTPPPTPPPVPPTPPPVTPPVNGLARYEPPDGQCYIGNEQQDMSATHAVTWKAKTGKGIYLYGMFQWFDSVPNINAVKTLCDGGYYSGLLMSWNICTEAYGGDEGDTTTVHQIVTGGYDSYLRQVAQLFKALPYTKFIVFGPEMNGFWEGYGHDVGVFKQAWIRTHDIFEQEGANVAWVFQPNQAPDNNPNWSYGNRELIMNYYPGDSYVDWMSVSCHVGAWGTSETVKQGMDTGGYLNLKPSKPFMFSEMGAARDWASSGDVPPLASRATWLTSFFNYCIANNKVKAFVYYNYDTPSMLDEPLLLTAFKNGVSNAKFIDS